MRMSLKPGVPAVIFACAILGCRFFCFALSDPARNSFPTFHIGGRGLSIGVDGTADGTQHRCQATLARRLGTRESSFVWLNKDTEQ